MHAKIINPKLHGKAAYENTGSAARTLNYLAQESKSQGKETTFFGAESDSVGWQELRDQLDGNVKGLKASDVKFYSLVLSPSAAELGQIGSDEHKLREYTRQVMEQYAGNFKLPNGRELTSADLVWGATIHHQRSYRGDDPQVQAGEKKAGEKKEGPQSHVHITVSARDASQKITLNPQGQKRRFDMQAWQGQAQQTFDKSFGKAPVQEQAQTAGKATRQTRREPGPEQAQRAAARQETRVRQRVEFINSQLGNSQRLEPESVVGIGRRMEYSEQFRYNLGFVAKRAEQGRPVEDPYQYLVTGRLPQVAKGSSQLKVVAQALSATSSQVPQRSHVQDIGEERGRGRGDGYGY